MTERKPPNVSIPDWVERQIGAAEAAGAFQNLPGTGKPIAGLNQPRHDLEWVANYLRRENVDAALLLPPALALAKEVERLPELLQAQPSEFRVRAIVDDLNRRINAAHARPQVGPPMRVRCVDVESAVAEWHTVRPAATAPPESALSPGHRRRFGRRGARRR
jgi:Domain of unknown function (DUF1992)